MEETLPNTHWQNNSFENLNVYQSSIIYLCLFQNNPKIILIKELNNMFYKFIWEDKPDTN